MLFPLVRIALASGFKNLITSVTLPLIIIPDILEHGIERIDWMILS